MSTTIEEGSGLIPHSAGVQVANSSGLSDTIILESTELSQVVRELSKWTESARSAASKGMFERGAFVPPDNPYDEMRAALRAMREDDIVGGVAEITESFAFEQVKWEGRDSDTVDLFNQWSALVNLDGVIRKMWRDTYAISQFVCAMEWGWHEFRLRGETENGNQRKARRKLWVPTKVRVIDSTKVVPVAHSPMGDEWLAWCATAGETQHWTRVRQGIVSDPLMNQLYVGRYTPGQSERGELAELGVDPDNLMLLNPEMVFRHTLTKGDYERFADIRMKSLFKLLDMKQQLLNSDRATLIGAANYILLIKKGTEQMPAQAPELRNLKENYNVIAKLPVIISDHRLEVEIISPKTDFTLQGDRYDVLDTRLLMRLLGTLSLGAKGQRNETNITLSRAVGRNMQNRRHMIRRTIEGDIGNKIFDHPYNSQVFEEARVHGSPSLVFVPRNVALDIDSSFIQAIMGLRTQRELSRETILEYFGFDQEVEFQRRLVEEEKYDDTFKTHTPFDSPEGDPSSTGRQGGRPAGGGKSSGDTTKPADKTSGGNKSTGGDS